MHINNCNTKKRPIKRLMIELKDRRKFFTHPKNLPKLIEFSETFGAELSVVRTCEEPLDLISLAEGVCDGNPKTHKPNFELLEIKLTRPRKKISHAKTIQKWTKNQLIDGKSIRLCNLIKRYEKYNLTRAAMCGHFSKVRKELVEESFRVKKLGQGEYKLY